MPGTFFPPPRGLAMPTSIATRAARTCPISLNTQHLDKNTHIFLLECWVSWDTVHAHCRIFEIGVLPCSHWWATKLCVSFIDQHWLRQWPVAWQHQVNTDDFRCIFQRQVIQIINYFMSIETLWERLFEIWMQNKHVHLTKIHSQILCAKWRPHCPGDVIITCLDLWPQPVQQYSIIAFLAAGNTFFCRCPTSACHELLSYLMKYLIVSASGFECPMAPHIVEAGDIYHTTINHKPCCVSNNCWHYKCFLLVFKNLIYHIRALVKDCRIFSTLAKESPQFCAKQQCNNHVRIYIYIYDWLIFKLHILEYGTILDVYSCIAKQC